MTDRRVVMFSYLAVLALQPIWHGLLPSPLGKQNGLLVLLATLPLLFPLRGILAGKVRSMTWGGYVLVLYFIVAIMETWSNPAERIPAVAQLGLTLLYFTALVVLTQRLRRTGEPVEAPEEL